MDGVGIDGIWIDQLPDIITASESLQAVITRPHTPSCHQFTRMCCQEGDGRFILGEELTQGEGMPARFKIIMRFSNDPKIFRKDNIVG